MCGLSCHFSGLRYRISQPNILINATGNPQLIDFGWSSLMGDTDAVNALPPKYGSSTFRYGAPELDDSGAPRVKERTPTTMESDMYSLSMVIVEVRRLSFGSMICLCSDRLFPACDRKDSLPRSIRQYGLPYGLGGISTTGAQSLRSARDEPSSLEDR